MSAFDARLAEGMAGIDPAAWDRLAGHRDPFVSHAFLKLLEESGSAALRTGWQPLHLLVEQEGRLVAAAPLYAKSHSWGEYVFDHAWADALERAGGTYYPKLQVAVPFTPVPGSRLLAENEAARSALIDAMGAILRQTRLSSLHVTFCSRGEAQAMAERGFLERHGVQYHWHNKGFASFDEFLDELRSAKKKMIRKERQTVARAGVQIEILHGPALDAAAVREFYPFYLATVDKRWGNAYLTRELFEGLAADLAERIVLVLARRSGRAIAAALNLLGEDALYGRVWGALEDVPCLHFETCYYAAIEFAIAHGIARVEAGAQGQHKLARGYEPVTTYSAHLIADPGLRAAVARFLEQERRIMDLEIAELAKSLPFRKEAANDPAG